MRRLIASRLQAAKREAPHFAYVEEIDITELEALRKHLNGKKADPSERLTLLPFLGLALIRALRDFPQCNTTYDKARNVLLRHGAVNLGIADRQAADLNGHGRWGRGRKRSWSCLLGGRWRPRRPPTRLRPRRSASMRDVRSSCRRSARVS